jgi:hypothetical protein
MVSYYEDWATNAIDKEWRTVYTPYFRWFLFHNSNESVMFIPGTYAEMLKDYE